MPAIVLEWRFCFEKMTVTVWVSVTQYFEDPLLNFPKDALIVSSNFQFLFERFRASVPSSIYYITCFLFEVLNCIFQKLICYSEANILRLYSKCLDSWFDSRCSIRRYNWIRYQGYHARCCSQSGIVIYQFPEYENSHHLVHSVLHLILLQVWHLVLRCILYIFYVIRSRRSSGIFVRCRDCFLIKSRYCHYSCHFVHF